MSLKTRGLFLRRRTSLRASARAVRRATPLSGIARSTGIPEDRVERVVEAFRKEGFLNVWQGENASSPLIDFDA